MSPVSDSEHCKIEAKVDSQYNVVENHEISDPSRGLRRVPVRIVWQAERLIGRGGFARVYLQCQEGNEDNKRALKVIPAMGQAMSDEDCKRELLALIEFTKPKVGTNTHHTLKRSTVELIFYAVQECCSICRFPWVVSG
jgi:hypothetical protein